MSRAPLALAALTLATWAGVLAVPFHFDDFPTIVLDPATSDAGVLWERLSHGVRPLLHVTFFVDHALWGREPAGYHATNLALHLATVLGVWALARRRLAGAIGPFVAAAVFAVQPAGTEVVAYVSGRSTGLMTALLVAALLAHERARAGHRVRWHAISAGLAVAACLAKEVALIFPALLAVWELTRPGAARLRIGLAGVGVCLALATATILAFSPRYRFLAAYSLALRGPLESLRANLGAVPIMLSLWFRPWALSVDHGVDPAVASAAAIPGALVLVALLFLAELARGRAPLVALAVWWALVALVPTSSFIAKLDLVTEKPLYLAWIGPSLAIGALAQLPRARWLCLAAFAMVPATVARVAMWQDPRALWADAVAKAPDHARAWNNLGMAYTLTDENQRAREAFETAVELDPDDVDARVNLARSLDSP